MDTIAVGFTTGIVFEKETILALGEPPLHNFSEFNARAGPLISPFRHFDSLRHGRHKILVRMNDLQARIPEQFNP